jgi:hypothetical protein
MGAIQKRQIPARLGHQRCASPGSGMLKSPATGQYLKTSGKILLSSVKDRRFIGESEWAEGFEGEKRQ